MNKINKKYFAIIFLAFVIIFSNTVHAGRYFYVHENNQLSEYIFDSDSMVPFVNYDFINLCTEKMSKNTTLGNISFFLPLNIRYIESDCDDQFLYRTINYILYKKNVSVLYDSEELKSSATELVQLFNLSAPIYSNGSLSSNDTIFIGKSFLNDLEIKENESVIGVIEDNSSSYIIITALNNYNVLKSINLITKKYNEDFSTTDCILLRGCGGKSLYENKANLKDVLYSIKEWTLGLRDVKSVIEIINQWKAS